MTQATNKQQYINAWSSHINELINIFIDADTPINDWGEAKANLQEVMHNAANNIFNDDGTQV